MSADGMVGTMTLTDFLLARIAEDESAARATVSATWFVSDTDSRWVVNAFGEAVATARDDRAPVARVGAAHIARHDPARVLAECEAKRRIVEYHAPVGDPATCDRCVEDVSWGEVWSYEAFPCPTLRYLATAYADHPDYDPAWRP